jgi:thiol-disulfide isomerase/thioredoxin
VLLYFFEVSCPKCKRKWPGLMKLAAQHRDDPIAFVAVNSGTPAPMIQRYASSVRLNWPIMLDLDRSFERLADIGEISLENITQICYLTADGELKRGRWSDVDGTIERALEGASWKIDPVEIPDELRGAWRNIEFANYAAAARTVTKALGSGKSEIRSAARKLVDVVDLQARADLDAAESEAAQSVYRAYVQYGGIIEQYAGFSAAQEAAAKRRTLTRDPQLRKELVAIMAIGKQRPLMASPLAAVRGRAVAAVKKIIDQNPDSEAARIGRDLLP